MTKRKQILNFLTRSSAMPILLTILVGSLPFIAWGVAVLGYQDLQIISAPGNPASGYLRFYAVTGALKCLTSAGANCFTGAIPGGTAGGDLSGTYPNPTVNKLNGTSLSGLATGLLKNTTSTGVPSIAAASDVYGLWSGTCSSSTYLSGSGACSIPAGGGASTQISQIIVSGSTTASVSFTSIPGTYTNLLLTMNLGCVSSGCTDNIYIQMNSDTNNDYACVMQRFNYGGVAYSENNGAQMFIGQPYETSDPSGFIASIYFYVYASTNANKWSDYRSNHSESTGDIEQYNGGCRWAAPSSVAISTITIFTSGGSYIVANSTFTLYGIQ